MSVYIFVCFHVCVCCQTASLLKSFVCPDKQDSFCMEKSIPFCCGRMDKHGCQPFHCDSHLVHSLVMKTGGFCFTLNIPSLEQWCKIPFTPWSRSGQIKPCQRRHALTLLVWHILSVGLANRHLDPHQWTWAEKKRAFLLGSLDFLANASELYTWRYSVYTLMQHCFASSTILSRLKSPIPSVKILVVEELAKSRAKRILSGFWPAPAPLHYSVPISYEEGVTACHCGRSTIRLGAPHYCGAEKRKASRSSSLFHSLFSLTFQSRESISCTHTCTWLSSFPFHLSIQRPVII